MNRVVITGNLTADPELKALQSGTSVCSMRLASNTRRKNQSSGEWEDKPNYFNVTVWGALGENCATFLQKGKPCAIDGRLEWREWDATDGSGKRQAVEIVAESVQFLGDGQGGGQGNRRQQAQQQAPQGGNDASQGGTVPVPAGDGSIPF